MAPSLRSFHLVREKNLWSHKCSRPYYSWLHWRDQKERAWFSLGVFKVVVSLDEGVSEGTHSQGAGRSRGQSTKRLVHHFQAYVLSTRGSHWSRMRGAYSVSETFPWGPGGGWNWGKKARWWAAMSPWQELSDWKWGWLEGSGRQGSIWECGDCMRRDGFRMSEDGWPACSPTRSLTRSHPLTMLSGLERDSTCRNRN